MPTSLSCLNLRLLQFKIFIKNEGHFKRFDWNPEIITALVKSQFIDLASFNGANVMLSVKIVQPLAQRGWKKRVFV